LNKPDYILAEEVKAWFGSAEKYIAFHEENLVNKTLLIDEIEES
jgi:hypothetical protein